MDKNVQFHPLFAVDISDAGAWYESRSPGLGHHFCEAVRDSIAPVIADPQKHTFIDPHIRYREVKKFPYLVLFEVNDEQLCMYAVIHAARSPDLWRVRRP